MSERKIVLYLEQKTHFENFRRFFQRTVETNHLRVADYYIFNSLGSEIEEAFKKINLPLEILSDFRKKSVSKIGIVRWNIIQKHLCNSTFDEKYDLDFVYETSRFFIDKKIPLIFKVDSEFLPIKLVSSQYSKFNLQIIKDNTLATTNIFRFNPLKYRIYLKDRLLVERYYPIDIERNRMIAEILYLKDTASGALRVESDFDLLIKRAEVDERKYDIYSSSFTLPNPDK